MLEVGYTVLGVFGGSVMGERQRTISQLEREWRVDHEPQTEGFEGTYAGLSTPAMKNRSRGAGEELGIRMQAAQILYDTFEERLQGWRKLAEDVARERAAARGETATMAWCPGS